MRAHLLKKAPFTVTYRDYKHHNEILFRYVLMEKLNNESKVDCESFETILTTLLSKFAPLRTKYLRANNQPFMNKTLSKAICNRSRLGNIFLMNPNNESKQSYDKYRNYCTNLLRREKKKYYSNLDPKLINDNKRF